MQEISAIRDGAGLMKYGELFGGRRLISLAIIQRIYPQVGRILISAATRFSQSKVDYSAVLDDFTSLVRSAEKNYNELFNEGLLRSSTP